MKRIFFILLLTAILFPFFLSTVFAADPTLKLQVPIEKIGTDITLCSGSGDDLVCNGIATYITAVYEWLIRLAIVLGTLAMTFAGYLWMTARGDKKQTEKAVTMIKNTLWGIVLALGSYILLWAINPNLVQLNVLNLGKVKPQSIIVEHPTSSSSSSYCDVKKLKRSPGISKSTFTNITFDDDAKDDLEAPNKVVQALLTQIQQLDAAGFTIKASLPSDKNPEHIGAHQDAITAVDYAGSKAELDKLGKYVETNRELLNLSSTYIYNDAKNGETRHVDIDCEKALKAETPAPGPGPTPPITPPTPPPGGGSPGGAPPAACGKGTSEYKGTVSANGTWTQQNNIDIWVPSAFQNGDKADVLYYFHGILGTGGSCSGSSDTRATMLNGGAAFTVIKNLIASGSIKPIVLVVPHDGADGKTNRLAQAQSTVQSVLTSKGISVVSESIAGHSNGGVPLAANWDAGSWKYIGMIDPAATGISDTMLNGKKDHVIYNYRVANWTGSSAWYVAQKKRLQEIGTALGQAESSSQHCPMVAEHMQSLTKCFAP